MNYIRHLRIAYIFLSQITFIGFYDHAYRNFLGLFLAGS